MQSPAMMQGSAIVQGSPSMMIAASGYAPQFLPPIQQPQQQHKIRNGKPEDAAMYIAVRF